MGNPNKDNNGATNTGDITSPWDAHHANRDLSKKREAWDAALAKTIAKAVAREMAKAHAHYQALLNEKSTVAMPTSLKVTSGASVFKVMDPLTGLRKKLSTSNGNYGQRRLDMPLMLQKETQKNLRFHTSTIGLMERE